MIKLDSVGFRILNPTYVIGNEKSKIQNLKSKIDMLHLKVLLPTNVLIDQPVTKIIAESDAGAFCVLPRHIDVLAALVPGILIAHTLDHQEILLAVDGGLLVKCGSEVLVSTRNAFRGQCLEQLRQEVEHQFKVVDEQERRARMAIARIEASVARQFTALAAE